MQIKFYIPVFLSCLLAQAAPAQEWKRYNTYSYSVNEGLLQSNVLDIGFDQNNSCWLSFANGIQKFDGNSFTDVQPQAGLPDDKDTRFFRQKNGSLLVCHAAGISRYDVNRDKFLMVYRNAPGAISRPVIIGEYDKKLFVFTGDAGILSLQESNYAMLKKWDSGLPVFKNNVAASLPSFSDVLKHTVHIYINGYFYYYDLDAGKIINRSQKMNYVNADYLGNCADGQVQFFKYDDAAALVKYNYDTKTTSIVFKRPLNYTRTFRGTVSSWNGRNVMSYYNRLYEMNAGLDTVLYEMIDLRNRPVLENAAVWKTAMDNFGNLFLVTINDGIRKLAKRDYAFKYFGIADEEDNYTISTYADKSSNSVLAGTYGSGLLVFDTLEKLKKHIQFLPGSNRRFSVNAITSNAKGEFIFLSSSHESAWLLGKDLQSLRRLTVKRTDGNVAKVGGYYGCIVAENESRAILQSGYEIYIVNKSDNEITQYSLGTLPSMGSVLFGNSLVYHSNERLYFLDTTTFKPYKSIALPNTGGVRCYKTVGAKIYLGTNNGLFIIDADGKIVKRFDKSTGLPDECIYAIQLDKQENIWCSSNKGIFRINPAGRLMQLTRYDGLQENEFNTNTSYKTSDGEMYFGGINGLNSFYPASVPDFMVDVTIYLNQVKVNNVPLITDTATWNIEKIVLPYDQHTLSLQFIASGPGNSSQYVHQYKMEGADKEWIRNDGMQPARYVLPPGRYVFKMYASSYFEKNAVALKELVIIIHPPFYKTWWFISLLGLLLVGLVVYIVNLYNRIRYRKKMAVLIAQQKVKEEKDRISMELHDSIGAYANAVLYNTELLESEKEEPEKKRLMRDLRFVSKDIITSLRETIWALKADNYTAQEALIRIRNFIHPFSRYYPAIHFRMEGEAPSQGFLHYGEALNMVRIVQEAVNNAIKHSNPTAIAVLSEPAGNKWRLTISDNGTGFDQSLVNEGNGLLNMKKRAAEHGFALQVNAAKGKGTVITIEVQLNLS